jgi:anti-repressor protein
MTSATDAARRLVSDEKGVATIDTLGGPQCVTVVNEAGSYEAMRPSQKPFGKRFWHWVCHEVLPSIRKTGGFGPGGYRIGE